MKYALELVTERYLACLEFLRICLGRGMLMRMTEYKCWSLSLSDEHFPNIYVRSIRLSMTG
jgi:hypothetical protein